MNKNIYKTKFNNTKMQKLFTMKRNGLAFLLIGLVGIMKMPALC